MSEKEREILEKLSEIVPKIPDAKKERLLWIAEGMSIVKISIHASAREATLPVYRIDR